MELIVVKNYDELSNAACKIVTNSIQKNNKLVLGLATGGTPERLYQKLINNKTLDWSSVITFNLDEYIGLEPTSAASYRHYMNQKLFQHIKINEKNTYVPIGTGDVEKNAKNYQKLIESYGGIDLQILGIGANGHIAFNEPGSSPTAKMSIVRLTKSTINANARYFKKTSDVPKAAITMGIGTILTAKSILLLASGANKAKAIKETIEGKVTSDVPASYLQNHPNVKIIVDVNAAKLLNR